MRLSKFLSLVTFTTALALLYVYQQTEIFSLGYSGQKKATEYQNLLDKNTVLRYNIEKNASLIRLGNKAYETASYEMPGTYRVVKLPYSRQVALNKNLAKKENFLGRIFGIKAQAEAKTINP